MTERIRSFRRSKGSGQRVHIDSQFITSTVLGRLLARDRGSRMNGGDGIEPSRTKVIASQVETNETAVSEENAVIPIGPDIHNRQIDRAQMHVRRRG
jgi:hypothetical protein